MSSLTIVSLNYDARRRPPQARRSVVSALNVLARKVKVNGEGFRIRKTPRRGPYPSEFWMERS